MTSARRASVVGFLVLLGLVLAITLSPTPVDQGRGAWVAAVLSVLHRIGVSESFGYSELETASNIVMFIPLGVVLALALPPARRWIGFVVLPLLSAVIECAQFVVLPRRYSSFGDVVANSIGGWIGVSLVIVIAEFVAEGRQGQ